MTSAPIHAADLSPYTFDQPCPRWRRRAPAMVIFDRECAQVIGPHYHRHCGACDGRWLEKCAPP
jgi:hypothetical protein